MIEEISSRAFVVSYWENDKVFGSICYQTEQRFYFRSTMTRNKSQSVLELHDMNFVYIYREVVK